MTADSKSVADREDVTVLIPAAGRVPEGLLALSNVGSPAMIPVAGRPVIYWTLSYLRSLGLRRFVIGVARRGMFIEDFVECAFGSDCEIEFVVPQRPSGLGRTVLDLAERVKTRAALVVLGDTHFQFADVDLLASPSPFVLVGSVVESSRWCIARLDADGRVLSLADKEPDLPPPLQALIGVYYFPDATALRSAAGEAVGEAESAGRSTEMAPILERVGRTSALRAAVAGQWLDCGNPDSQASSHRALLQSRDFNELTIDPVLGTVTKRSRRVEKFIEEINYLRLLPPRLAVLFPRVLDYSTEWALPFVTLEYYGYPTLAEIFVFENVDPGIWERIFAHLRSVVVDGFMGVRRPLGAGSLRSMYLEKTRQRLDELTGPPELLALVREEAPVEINGRVVPSLVSLWPRIAAAVAHLETNAVGSIIHGDLCFSNILYDLRSRIVKLIDPRGSFGSSGIYGDPRYDVAKLYHSVRGLYDFIVNDLFQLSVDGRRVRLDLRAQPHHYRIRERFEKVFFPDFDRREIALITGLLFASMPALHYDHPRRQLAMYANALLLFDEALSESPAEIS